MQLDSSPSLSSGISGHSAHEFAEISGKLGEDFGLNLRLNVSDKISEERELSENQIVAGDLREQEESVEEEEEEEEEEFSFVCANPDGSPISADDLFHDGRIRPMFPLFNQALLYENEEDGTKGNKAPVLRPPLKKLFMEEQGSTSSEEPEGLYCLWSGKAVEASPEKCKKSNSTGFSRLWRFRDLALRSHSDGKDAFVFLNPSTRNAKEGKEKHGKTENSEKVEKVETKTKKKGPVKGAKRETASWAHEMHYVKNRALKEEDKRKSYLPYRQDLVGFFTNVNGLSRNVHPF